MRYHFFQKFFGKMVKIKETSFLFIRGMILIFGNCTSCTPSNTKNDAFAMNQKILQCKWYPISIKLFFSQNKFISFFQDHNLRPIMNLMDFFFQNARPNKTK